MGSPRFLRFVLVLCGSGAASGCCYFVGCPQCACPTNQDAIAMPDGASWTALGPPTDGYPVAHWIQHGGACTAIEMDAGCGPYQQPGGPLPPPELAA